MKAIQQPGPAGALPATLLFKPWELGQPARVVCECSVAGDTLGDRPENNIDIYPAAGDNQLRWLFLWNKTTDFCGKTVSPPQLFLWEPASNKFL